MGEVIQPVEVRSRLREALEVDLIGPGAGHPLAHERLPGWVRPSNWYLTGSWCRATRRPSSALTLTRTTTSTRRSPETRDWATTPRRIARQPGEASFLRRWA